MAVEHHSMGPLLVLLLPSIPLMIKATNWFQTYQATSEDGTTPCHAADITPSSDKSYKNFFQTYQAVCQ
jgi:hypothetical protein